jgi:polar amino acid transport system substrate-binding protein
MNKEIILAGMLLVNSLCAVNNATKIKIFTENYPPYNMEVNGKLKGLSVDILNAMLNQMKKKGDIKLKPWATGYKIVLKKKNTMLFSTTRTKQREKLFKWVGPIASTNIGIIAPKSKHLKIKKITDLNNYKIGAVINDIGEQLLLENGVNKKNIESVGGKNPIVLNFQKMGKGRIDAFSYETNVAMYGAKSYQIDQKDFEVVYILKKGQLYYAFNTKTDDSIIKAYQKALNKIKTNGIYNKILKKYKLKIK